MASKVHCPHFVGIYHDQEDHLEILEIYADEKTARHHQNVLTQRVNTGDLPPEGDVLVYFWIDLLVKKKGIGFKVYAEGMPIREDERPLSIYERKYKAKIMNQTNIICTDLFQVMMQEAHQA